MRHGRAGRLLAVAQGGVEDIDAIARRTLHARQFVGFGLQVHGVALLPLRRQFNMPSASRLNPVAVP
jgi:hypothetical protein